MTPPIPSPSRPPRRSAFGPGRSGGAGADADAGLAGGADAGLDVIVPAAIVRVDGLPDSAARAVARSGEIEMLPVGPEAWLAVSADLGSEAVQAAVEAAEAAETGAAATGTTETGTAGAGTAVTGTAGMAGTGAAEPGMAGTTGAGTAATGAAGQAGTGGGGGAASCTDLTHARTVLRVAGPHARARLARGCPLDLDTLEAGGGEDGAAAATAAATLLGPFEVVIRRASSAPDAFDVFVPRSMARSAREWLAAPTASV